MSLRLGNPQNAASVHQELEILCHGVKGGRFFHSVQGFQINFLELNVCVVESFICLTSMYGAPTTHQVPCGALGETTRSQLGGWDRPEQETIGAYALGAAEMSRRGSSSSLGWGWGGGGVR